MRAEGAGLAARLLAIGLLSALLVTTAGGWYLRHKLQDVVLRSVEQDLAERAERLSALLAPRDGEPGAPARLEAGGEFQAIFSGWYWQLHDGQGRVERSRSLWDSSLDTSHAASEPARAGLLRLPGPRGEALMGLRRELGPGAAAATLYVFGPAQETDAELERIDQVLLAAQGAFIVLLGLLTLLQVRVGLQPMRRLSSALAQVREGRAQALGTGYGPDLDPLAAQIDEVLARNARIVERSRHHAADLSHALKKPLALLSTTAARGELDRDQVRAQVATMSDLIDRHLARAGSGAGDMRWVSVAPRLQALVALMRTLHAPRHLVWTLAVPDDLRWNGEPTDLEEMVGNLLDNAGKWAASRVSLTASRREDGGVEVCVEDDGEGLQDHEVREAAQRGRRFDESVDGTGLGLAIVRDIADTYGGSLALGRGTLGGLLAVLRLG